MFDKDPKSGALYARCRNCFHEYVQSQKAAAAASSSSSSSMNSNAVPVYKGSMLTGRLLVNAASPPPTATRQQPRDKAHALRPQYGMCACCYVKPVMADEICGSEACRSFKVEYREKYAELERKRAKLKELSDQVAALDSELLARHKQHIDNSARAPPPVRQVFSNLSLDASPKNPGEATWTPSQENITRDLHRTYYKGMCANKACPNRDIAYQNIRHAIMSDGTTRPFNACSDKCLVAIGGMSLMRALTLQEMEVLRIRSSEHADRTLASQPTGIFSPPPVEIIKDSDNAAHE